MTDSGSQRSAPSYDASLADHGLEPREHKGLTYPLGDHQPDHGGHVQLLPGIGWTRLPVPGPLGHINIWLLDDDDPETGGVPGGVAIVDTGLHFGDSVAAWEKLFAEGLNGRPITRVFVTHFHPDHVGMAGWLCERFGVRLWMNRTEWLMARMLTADIRQEPPAEALAQMREAGWDEARVEKFRQRGWGNFAKMVSPLPISHVRLDEGAVISVGGHDWHILTGGGHTPEHACLYDRDRRILIAGDQVLPQITSNVSTMTSEPTADPLGEWLDSIAKFREAIDPRSLVLPAHGLPFTGVRTRLETLAAGHHARLDSLVEALAHKPLRAVDTFELLFARPITDEVYGLATGEAMAHLRHLEVTGRAVRTMTDGAAWFRAA